MVPPLSLSLPRNRKPRKLPQNDGRGKRVAARSTQEPKNLKSKFEPVFKMETVTLIDPLDRIVEVMGDLSSAYDVPYILMGRENGKDVTELQHLIRSLIDVLTTPIGSMPTLRFYGCKLFDYIDRPANEELKLNMLAAVHEAIDRWEPRLLLERVELLWGASPGQIILTIHGFYLLEGRGVTLNNLRLDFKKDVFNTHLDNEN